MHGEATMPGGRRRFLKASIALACAGLATRAWAASRYDAVVTMRGWHPDGPVFATLGAALAAAPADGRLSFRIFVTRGQWREKLVVDKSHIDPVRWDPMGYPGRDGDSVMLDPLQARLYEHDSHGPGAHRSPLRRRLTQEQVMQHTPRQVGRMNRRGHRRHGRHPALVTTRL